MFNEKMIVNISAEHFYLIVIAILMFLQIYQYSVITKTKTEISKLWIQVAMLALSLATKINEDNEKNKGTR
jgi:hypothetical protein